MRHLCSASFWLAAILYVSGMGTSWAQNERVALLVGNQGYNPGRLSFPHQDVTEMRKALLRIGFAPQNIKVVLDADQKSLRRATQEFGRLAHRAEVAFFYYSGHAAQAQGQNWLIPIGADIQTEAAYELEAVSAQAALSQLVAARPKVGVVVLDACRDNPIAVNKSGTKGLMPILGGQNTLIAFATAPNDTAADTGLYAKVLAAELQKPGVELLDVFRNTTSEVKRQTGNRQVPRISEVTLDGERIYLAGPAASGELSRPVTHPTPRPEPSPPVGTAGSGQTFTVKGVSFRMQNIPGGSFVMGSPESEAERDGDEGPQRRVSLKAYQLGQTEVTQGLWRAVMGGNPSRFSDCGESCPVEQVSWEDAQAFIRKLNELTGERFRLPSEAEWEYAARAGCETPFNVGGACRSKIEASEANFRGDITYNGSSKGEWRAKTTKVGSFQANSWGLHDMHGNVWEWVQDCYASSYDGAPTDGSAVEAFSCVQRVLRGGSWNSYPQRLRSAIRYWSTPDFRNYYTGFRLARTF